MKALVGLRGHTATGRVAAKHCRGHFILPVHAELLALVLGPQVNTPRRVHQAYKKIHAIRTTNSLVQPPVERTCCGFPVIRVRPWEVCKVLGDKKAHDRRI